MQTCSRASYPYVSCKTPFSRCKPGGISISSTLLAVYVITALVLLILWYITTRTELGLAMRAASQDMEISGTMGINSHFIVSITFVIGSAVAAVAGILVGIYYNQVYPTMGTVQPTKHWP